MSPGSLPFCRVMSRGPSMKTTILFSSLPVLSVLAGLGSGMVLAGGPSPAAEPAHLSAPSSGAEAPPSGDAMPAGGDGGAAGADPRPMDRVVQLGRITVPVQKARSVSYVVADFGISMQDGAMAAAFREPQAGLRLRSALLAAMAEASALPLMRGVSIDTEALSAHLVREMAREFDGVEDVLFISFHKSDVPRA